MKSQLGIGVEVYFQDRDMGEIYFSDFIYPVW